MVVKLIGNGIFCFFDISFSEDWTFDAFLDMTLVIPAYLDWTKCEFSQIETGVGILWRRGYWMLRCELCHVSHQPVKEYLRWGLNFDFLGSGSVNIVTPMESSSSWRPVPCPSSVHSEGLVPSAGVSWSCGAVYEEVLRTILTPVTRYRRSAPRR